MISSVKNNGYSGVHCVHPLIDIKAEKLCCLLGLLPCALIQEEELLLVMLDI